MKRMSGYFAGVFSLIVVLLLVVLLGVRANAANETKEAKIKRAMSAGPLEISKDAKIGDMDENGKMIILREGHNGWTCFPGQPGVIGDDPQCADEVAMQWTDDWMAHKRKPTNTIPGVVYMLAGGTDWSVTDPYATSGAAIHEPLLAALITYVFLLLLVAHDWWSTRKVYGGNDQSQRFPDHRAANTIPYWPNRHWALFRFVGAEAWQLNRFEMERGAACATPLN